MTAVDASASSIGQEPLQTGLGAALRHFCAGANAWIESRLDGERDQLPLWLPVGVGAGIGAWFELPGERTWEAFLLAAAALVLLPLALAPGTRWARAAALFAGAACLGCLSIWWSAERVAAPRLTHERAARFEAQVESVQAVAATDAVRLVVAPVNAPDLPPRLRVNVPRDKAPLLVPGAHVRLRAWLMPPAPAAVPGAHDFSRAAWFQGIGGSGRALEIEVLPGAADPGLRGRIAAVRQALGSHIVGALPGGEGGVAVALATGDQGAIPAADSDAMRRAGLAHLLAVSGLHLTTVVGLVMLLTLKLLALSPRLALRFRLVLVAAAVGALAGVAYTILTGAGVPTIRSCIASLLVLAGVALGRDAVTLRLVAVGALVVLFLWPDSLVGASFQLSFAAIATLVAFHDHPKVRAFLARRDESLPLKLGRGLLGLLLTGLAVEVALAPIALFHFHRAGLYGAVANIVAIPLTTFVIMPFEGLALLFDSVGLGAPFWWVAGQGLHILLVVAHRTAATPGATAMLPSIPDGAFALMLLGGLWICLWRTRWRWWGLGAVAAGALWALATPAPDLLITGDGRHLALRMDSGQLGMLRERAGDYVRSTMAESSGLDGAVPDLDDVPGAICTDDSCTATLRRGGRAWQVLAIRTRARFDPEPLALACASADIVVSDRRLPRRCAPRWLKADAALLGRTGGMAITLGAVPWVQTVAERTAGHPWAQAPAPRSRFKRRRSWPLPPSPPPPLPPSGG